MDDGLGHEQIAASAGTSGFSMSISSLKYIAAIAMLIDHIAWAFVPGTSLLGIVMHFIGRITAPIMFFAAVEGYHHTGNINRYMARLAVFALISWFPFIYFYYGGRLTNVGYLTGNVIYTILLGVAAIRVRRELKNPILKVILIFALIILSAPADWRIWGVIIMIIFDFYYGNFKNQAFGYCLFVLLYADVLSMIITPFTNLFYGYKFHIDVNYYKENIALFGMFLPIILLSFYSGKRGPCGKFSKWFFYIFYPVHLFILGYLKTIC